MSYVSSSQIAIVIVLFYPNEKDIDNVIALAENYDGVIVDNSETPSFSNSQIGHMYYMPLEKNKGIAEAHNRAIDFIIRKGQAQYIILLDQDSRLTENYPQNIVYEFKIVKERHPNLVALGPTIIQKETGKEYCSAIHHDHYLDANFILKKDIIASGCCFSLEGINSVGLFDPSLFIDFVDTEWCYRAKSKGYVYGITPNIQLKHKVGRDEIHIGKHIVSVSVPFRYYYQYRNYTILLFRKYVPLSFKINFGIKFFLRFFYFPFFAQDGWECWKYMLKGILNGLKTITTTNKI